MRATFLLLGATALTLAPAVASAQTAPGQGQYNGSGYWHTNSGAALGQPGVECEDLIADGEGAAPGNTANAPGTAFGGSAHDKYAGEQPQNSRNTASTSQYDVACAKQPL
jgi:hypothetical protein